MPPRARIHFVCAYPRSIYTRLLSAGFDGAYGAEQTPIEALPSLGAGDIIHTHWEEFALRNCASDADAERAADGLIAAFDVARARGARLVHTIHNAMPHEARHTRAFLKLRRALCGMSDLVLAHDAAGEAVLREQLGDGVEVRVRVLPHPSYLGIYEPEQALDALPLVPPSRTLLCFGVVRAQKGLAELLECLTPDYLARLAANLRISGDGDAADDLAAAIADRADVQFDRRFVPREEVPDLLRSAAALVLPYKTFLTSGAALLSLSCGVPLVAPDVPQMRSLVPQRARRLLFRTGDCSDIRRGIGEALALAPEERAEIVQDGLDIARAVHPVLVSKRLQAFYDEVLAAPVERPR